MKVAEPHALSPSPSQAHASLLAPKSARQRLVLWVQAPTVHTWARHHEPPTRAAACWVATRPISAQHGAGQQCRCGPRPWARVLVAGPRWGRGPRYSATPDQQLANSSVGQSAPYQNSEVAVAARSCVYCFHTFLDSDMPSSSFLPMLALLYLYHYCFWGIQVSITKFLSIRWTTQACVPWCFNEQLSAMESKSNVWAVKTLFLSIFDARHVMSLFWVLMQCLL